MKSPLIIVAIALSFAFSNNVPAQPVTAEFLTHNAGVLQKIRMDRPGDPYSHGVEGVKAEFYSTGSRDLVIGLNIAKAKRTTIFDLSEISSATNVPAWVYSSPIQTFKPYFNVIDAYHAKEDCQPDAGGVYNCDFAARMNAGYLSAAGDSASYAMLWNPEATGRPVNSPESTSFVNVNYYKGTTGGEVFTITPLPNCATRANNFTCAPTDEQRVVAGLEKTSKRSVTGAGQYVMPFTLVVRPK